MPRWCSRRMRPTWRIRRSATCSLNPQPSPTTTRSSARGGRAGTKGGCIWAMCWPGGRASETPSNSKPIASTSSAAARAPAGPRRSRSTAPLSGATGAVLDPIVSLRARLRVPPGVTARVSFTTVVAEHEDGVRALIEKYHDPQVCGRAFALASTHSEIELRHLGVSREDGSRFQRLAGRVIYGDPRLRSPEAILRSTGTPPDLWKYGISGDLPIVLVTVADARTPQPRAGARPRAGVPPRAGLQVRPGRAQRNSDELSPGRAG